MREKFALATRAACLAVPRADGATPVRLTRTSGASNLRLTSLIRMRRYAFYAEREPLAMRVCARVRRYAVLGP